MRRVALALATCFGVGYAPVAPGTFGSLAGLALWLVLPTSAAVGIAIVVTFLAGAWASSVAEKHFSATDPGPAVIDEVMGMLVTMFMNPSGWVSVGAGFFLFRLFDVIKPYPANRLERLPGGIGIMADDLMAAIYANLVLRVGLAASNWVIG
jgi:phosphatidylglycerophosphatase A